MKRNKILYIILIIIIIAIIATSCIYFSAKKEIDITGYWNYDSCESYEGNKLTSEITGINAEHIVLNDGRIEKCISTSNGQNNCTLGTYTIDEKYINIKSSNYAFYGKYSYTIKAGKLILTKTVENNKYICKFKRAEG